MVYVSLSIDATRKQFWCKPILQLISTRTCAGGPSPRRSPGQTPPGSQPCGAGVPTGAASCAQLLRSPPAARPAFPLEERELCTYTDPGQAYPGPRVGAYAPPGLAREAYTPILGPGWAWPGAVLCIVLLARSSVSPVRSMTSGTQRASSGDHSDIVAPARRTEQERERRRRRGSHNANGEP